MSHARRTLSLTFTIALTAALGLSTPALGFDFEWLGKIEADAEGLSSKKASERRIAVTKLGRYDIDLTKQYLLTALGDQDQRVRFEAGRILAKRKVAEAAPVIIGWLERPDVSIRRDAALILASFATEDAITALIRSLGDPDDDVREKAAAALGEIGTPRVVIPLIGRLEDAQSNVEMTAIRQLGKLGDARAVIPLVGKFSDSNVDVRAEAVRAIGNLGDKSPVPALLRLLRDPVEKIKQAAVESLGNLRVVEAADALIVELGRGSDVYSGKVAYALGKIAQAAGDAPAADTAIAQSGERAVHALVRALASNSLNAPASEALRNAGDIAVPALVAHLEGKLDSDTRTAIRLLGDIGDKRAAPALIAELDRGRVPYDMVLSALETCGDGSALMPIVNLLSSRDDQLRLRAMTALRAVITDGRAADTLLGLLSDKNVEIRILAVEYLGLMRAPSAVPRLIELTRTGTDVRVRTATIDALGEIADARATSALLDVLERGPASLASSVVNALIYIADANAIGRLSTMARDPGAAARAHAVRAIGGILRDTPHDKARTLLGELAQTGPRPVALAAIEALGSMGDAKAISALLPLVTADNHRRSAAAAALGNLGDRRAVPSLVKLLVARDDRVSAAAALGLHKIRADDAIDLLLMATKRRGWATVINASAAVAAHASAVHTDKLVALLKHKNRFVRANAAMGLGRLYAGNVSGLPASARARMQARLQDDDSSVVRVAVIRAFSAIDAQAPTKAARDANGLRASIQSVLDRTHNKRVRTAAKRALDTPFVAPKRTDWRTFHVVDPNRADAPIRQEPYFLVSADGIATAHYTDARGIITEERFPPGEYILAPRNQRTNY